MVTFRAISLCRYTRIATGRSGSARSAVGWFESRAVALKDQGGAVAGWFGALTDVDDTVRASEAFARHQEDLERLVKDRTAEVERTHERLRQADRLAAIGTLAAGLGHDMNNVLLPIRCRLDAMDAGVLPAKDSAVPLDRLPPAVGNDAPPVSIPRTLTASPREH